MLSLTHLKSLGLSTDIYSSHNAAISISAYHQLKFCVDTLLVVLMMEHLHEYVVLCFFGALLTL